MNTATMFETRQSGQAGLLSTLSEKQSRSVLRALADDFSARIMVSAIERPRTVEEVSKGERIPLSTCYRRTRELVDEGLMVVERIVVTGSGKRYALYRSCYRSFRIFAGPYGVTVDAELNEDVAERVHYRQASVAYSGHSVFDLDDPRRLAFE